jgi:hypothetical protein
LGCGVIAREGEKKSGAVAWLTFSPDSAAVTVNDVFDYGKAQAGSALLARTSLVNPVKPFKDPL